MKDRIARAQIRDLAAEAGVWWDAAGVSQKGLYGTRWELKHAKERISVLEDQVDALIEYLGVSLECGAPKANPWIVKKKA